MTLDPGDLRGDPPPALGDQRRPGDDRGAAVRLARRLRGARLQRRAHDRATGAACTRASTSSSTPRRSTSSSRRCSRSGRRRTSARATCSSPTTRGGARCTPTTASSRRPIFWEGEIVAWAGIVMHDDDVGSPVPGSFVVGARGPLRRGAAVPGDEDGRGLRAAGRHRARLPAQPPHARAQRAEPPRPPRLDADHPPAHPRAHRAVRPGGVPGVAGGDHRLRRAGRPQAPARHARRRVGGPDLPRPRRPQRRDVPHAAAR